uniref:Uncharacterized protein n=2 Tax=Rhodnius prolixus TaxID=13249 RepID=T1I6Z5_RHOPR
MGVLYSKISRLQLDDKVQENSLQGKEEIKVTTDGTIQKTPRTSRLKYLEDPRSASAGIKRTPIVVVREASPKPDAESTPVRPLPYLETNLDSSLYTIRTSTPVSSASPMQEMLQPSPVLLRAESLDTSINQLSVSQQDDVLSVASDEENSTEELFNNERMLFDSVEQESFEEGNENKIETYEIDKKEEIDTPEILFLSQDLDGTDNEVEEILSDEKNSTTADNSLEREFSEIESCLFSPVNPSVADPNVIKSVPHLRQDNHLFKTKTGRTPLGTVSSNPCSPMQSSNFIANKDADVAKPWRGLTEERVNRGLLDIENTPPLPNLPPPDIIQSAPGKLLLSTRTRA